MSDIEEDYRKLVLDPNFIAARGHLATMLERNTALRAENERLRAALIDHNDMLRSAFQAAQRDAIAEVIGTTNYNNLADAAYKVLRKHHAITNKARVTLSGADAPDPWQPIETVPKNGTRLLLAYQTPYKKWRRVVAFYAPKLTIETNNDDCSDWHEYDEANDRYCLPEGWYECIENWDDYSSVHMSGVDPTHWMPLPPPPKTEET